ncbi:hypothetical protein F2Q70_00044399 [Brassica cretica]|uniref:Uncharacterized protein n=1 Tax=Brassica cretica TaxID=69181 RepID=A0A3N6S678_BRACR|nr:hypothetical protein F2Q70_00044399 [Brassica cretica]KAF3521111.1 hypothetical protein DY000_02062160 [Brassica cretica]
MNFAQIRQPRPNSPYRTLESHRKSTILTSWGANVATELEPSVLLGRYVATELFRNVECNTNPCILVYPLMLSPEDRSKSIS